MTGAAIATALLLAAGHVFLRLLPVWPHRDQGCDAYYYLFCAEAFRRKRQLPIVLPPYYLLEPQDQAYPPAMSVLLSLLPEGWFARYHWLVSPMIDALSLLLVALWVGSRFGAGAALLCGFAYSANASLVAEFCALTSRPLALIETCAFALMSYLWIEGWTSALPVAVLLGVLVLYTHKLSVQLLWFLVPALALSLGDARWLVPLPAAYALAFALAPRYFLRLLDAHRDIVRYWRRNWPLLGAHVVRQSPLYRSGETIGYYRRHDLLRVVRQVAKVLDYNCFILFVPLALAAWPRLTSVDRFALVWCAATCGWAGATYFVAALRCFGEGNKYFKYALAPSLMLAASCVIERAGAASITLAVFCAVWTVVSYGAAVRRMRGPMLTTGRLPPELEGLLDHLTSDDRVMCLPVQLADLVAWRVRCAVLWGGHNYQFERLQPFYPVLERRVEDFVAQFALTHLLLDERYAALGELRLSAGAVVARGGSFVLVGFAAGA